MRKRKDKTFSLTWRGTLIAIRHTRDYLVRGTDHIEVMVKKPAKAILPITDTGYRSHFLDPEQLATEGGPVLFVQAWLEREAATKQWRAKEAKMAQLDFLHLLIEPNPRRKMRPRSRAA
jgi:hypothetical protein